MQGNSSKAKSAQPEVHPTEACLIEVGQACAGCSDDLSAWLVEIRGRWRLFVKRPESIYEVRVEAVTVGVPSGPG